MDPDRWSSAASVLLRIGGVHLPTQDPIAIWLQGRDTPDDALAPAQVALHPILPVSDRLLVGLVPAGLPAGDYDLWIQAAEQLPLLLERAATVEPATPSVDQTPPEVWLELDPSRGVRPDRPLELKIGARDPAGIALLGFDAIGLLDLRLERSLEPQGPESWTIFSLELPVGLEPYQLFWIIPYARDRLGNHGSSTLAYSIVICDPAGGSPDWECQN